MTMLRRRDLLAAGAALAAWPAAAQTDGTVRVSLQTGLGTIVMDLYGARAPITVANFLRYVDEKRLDGAPFFRAYKITDTPLSGLVQAHANPDKLLPPIAHESTAATGLTHRTGTVSMARREQGTAQSDFFICMGHLDYLDANPAAAGDNAGYAAFGEVTAGYDVIQKLLTSPTTADGPPGMAGQILATPVPIIEAKRA